MTVGAGNFKHVDRQRVAAELNVQRINVRSVIQPTKHSVGWSDYGCLPACTGEGNWQVTDNIANAADFAGRQRTVLRGNEYDSFVVDENRLELTREVQLLTEHIRSYESQSAVGDTKAARTIRFCVLANDRIGFDNAALIDNCTVNSTALANYNVRQYNRISYFAIGVNGNIREHYGLINVCS